MLTLFTDTDTDTTPAIAKKYGYKLISMPYSIDGKSVYPYEDFEEFDADAFYDQLRVGVIPKTSSISAEKYRAYFEPELAKGNDILYVHFSRSMSATFDAMDRTIKELEEKYPSRRIYTLDTKAITILSLNIIEEIGDLYQQGKTVEEIFKWAETEIQHFAVYFFADDLKFFMHSGRVSGLAGTMGTLLGVRPIININAEGKMDSIGKAKGRINALKALVDKVVELGDEIEKHRIILASAGAKDLAHQLGEMLCEATGKKLSFQYVDVNPTAGSHCGPNTVGVSFHARCR